MASFIKHLHLSLFQQLFNGKGQYKVPELPVWNGGLGELPLVTEGHTALERGVKIQVWVIFFPLSPYINSKYKMQHAHQKVSPDMTFLNKRISRFPTTCAPLPFAKGWQRLSKKNHTHTQIEALHRAHIFHSSLCFQEAAVLTDKLLNFTTCSQNEKKRNP